MGGGTFCCVVPCRSRSHDLRGKKLDNGISFHRFPKWKLNQGRHVAEVTKRRRMAWVSAVRRPDITFSSIPISMRVCSLHFHSGKPAYEMLESHPDWAPSLHMGHNEVKATNPKRFARQSKREQERRRETAEMRSPAVDETAQSEEVPTIKEEAVEEAVDLTARTEAAPTAQEEAGEKPQAGEAAGGTNVCEPAAKRAMTECDLCERRHAVIDRLLKENEELQSEADAGQRAECDLCECRRSEIDRLLVENRQLKCELDKRKMNEQFLKDDDAKVKYYTGLNCFADLMGLLTRVMPHLPQTNRILSPFQMLFITLMRLRLNLPIQHIAHLFYVDRKTASTAFSDTLGVLHAHFSPLVHWPETRRMEKLIGNIRNKYFILGETISINMTLPCEGEEMTFHNKIVTVCYALSNMCTSVVIQPSCNSDLESATNVIELT